MTKRTISFYTLGCRLNQSETAVLERSVTEYPPGYKELFLMHLMELEEKGIVGFKPTIPLSKLVSKAIENGDRNEFTWFVEGMKASENGDDERAFICYTEAIKLSKKSHFAFNNRALLY